MAFSLRKMLSNISYFSKPGDDDNLLLRPSNETATVNSRQDGIPTSENIEFDRVEADSTSKCASLNLPNFVKNYATKKGSHSDTDIHSFNSATGKQERKKCRKLKLDIEKASKSMNDCTNYSENSSVNLENTPKHKLLDCKSADYFKGFNFNQSFDISDVASVASTNEDVDIESLSEHSDTDNSEDINGKGEIKMCRKVEHQSLPELLPSATPDSFADVEVDKNEAERMTLLFNYQMKLEQIECFLKKLLSEFQFHIEVSKVFDCKSVVTVPGTDAKANVNTDYLRCISPAWNIVMEKEDNTTKLTVKNQLLSMRESIDEFIDTYLQEPKPTLQRSLTYNLYKRTRQHKPNLSYKKKIKYFDFPDLREAMINLFSTEDSGNDSDSSKCSCQCHSDPETPKSDKETRDQSITSSIGNFTLDSTTLSAYSESLDQIISYNSFETDTLYNTLLQKSAIERISFYIQVHSIQLKCEASDLESKAIMTFYCPTCKTTDNEENGLLKHILSPNHCEKLHFVYKTAYVKKCISTGKEIQPSTVLNPMTMYRDDNKIVCFGDAMYACSLCFENLIIGESVLMSHCHDEEHVTRREMLTDIFD